LKVLGFSDESPRLIAVERDVHLAELLRKKFTGDPLVEVVQDDALKVLPTITTTFHLKPSTWKIVGNIPYYITGHLLRLLGGLAAPPSSAVFLVQAEVAERAVAEPPHMNRLAASIRLWAEPRLLFRVPREDFRPRPKVESAVLLLVSHGRFSQSERDALDALVGTMFQQPRKTVLNNLRAGYELPTEKLTDIIVRAGLRPNDRPQNVSLERLALLAQLLHRTGGGA